MSPRADLMSIVSDKPIHFCSVRRMARAIASYNRSQVPVTASAADAELDKVEGAVYGVG